MKYALILVVLLSFSLPVAAIAQESDLPPERVEVNRATVEAGDGEADTDASLNPCWYRVAQSNSHCYEAFDACLDKCAEEANAPQESSGCRIGCERGLNACLLAN